MVREYVDDSLTAEKWRKVQECHPLGIGKAEDVAAEEQDRCVDAQHGHPEFVTERCQPRRVLRAAVARDHDLDAVEARLRGEAEGLAQASGEDARRTHADLSHTVTVRRDPGRDAGATRELSVTRGRTAHAARRDSGRSLTFG
jgi:hypothetical protein